MKAPPGVSLAGAEAFARIEIELPNDIEADIEEGRSLLEHFWFTLETADVADAVRLLRIDLKVAEYFASPWSLPAREFGLAGTSVSGVVVSGDTEAFPY